HGPRVTQHELDTPGRVLRVDGQVDGTGLQYAKQRDDQVSVTRQRNGHHLLRTDTPPDQVPGNLVSAVVQLRERQPAGAGHEGARVRRPGDLGLEHIRQSPAAGPGCRVIPAAEDQLALVRGQYVQ